MTDEERMQVAFVAGMLLKISTGSKLTDEEIQSLQNIVEDLGFYNIPERYFRY